MAAKKAAPKLTVDDGSGVSPEPVTEKPVPELPVFSWDPKDGGDPIVLPHASTAVPKGKMLKFFYEMNKRQNDFVGQIMFAMQSAGVPVAVQDRVFDLDDDEAMDLVNAWAAALTGASLGES